MLDRETLTYLARLSVLQHLTLGVIAFFNFQFICSFGAFSLAVQKLFLIGDYSVGGYFDEKGIDWREHS